MSVQPQFTGEKTDPEVEGEITRLISNIPDKRLDKKWKRIEVRIHPPVTEAAVVEQLHQIWNTDYVSSVKSPEGLPCLPNGTLCPPGARLIEVSYISRVSGGMGSYHQFDGYFISLVLAPDLVNILDGRIEKAY